MTISASFTVGGVSNPAAHTAAYSSTVSLALVSTTGAGTILWEVVACSKSGASLPSVTRAGTPNGATASFVLPSDPGDGLGRAYLVKCSVSDSRTTVVEYAVVGALNAAGLLPIVPGEENARDATHGWSQTVNQALASTATPVPTTLGTPVANIAALKAVGASDRVDNQSRAVGSPAQVWIYSSGTGAGFASDDLTVVRPTDVLLASNGRWYPASPSAVVPTIAALRLAVSGAQSCIHVQSYSTLGDGGGGIFDFDSSDTTSSDDGGTLIVAGSRRFRRRFSGALEMAWFGARGNGQYGTATSTASSAVVTIVSGTVPTNADAGKVFTLRGAGAGGDPLVTTIVSASGSSITLATTASLSVTAKTSLFGTNDQAAFDLVTPLLKGWKVKLKKGCYLLGTGWNLDGTGLLLNNIVIEGDGNCEPGYNNGGTILAACTVRQAYVLRLAARHQKEHDFAIDGNYCAINPLIVDYQGVNFSFENINVTRAYSPPRKTVSFNFGTNVATSAAHGFANGYRLAFDSTASLPGEFTANTNFIATGNPGDSGLGRRWAYFVINATTNTFQVARKAGGSAVSFLDAGTGTLTVGGYGDAIVQIGTLPTLQIDSCVFKNCIWQQDFTSFAEYAGAGVRHTGYNAFLITLKNVKVFCARDPFHIDGGGMRLEQCEARGVQSYTRAQVFIDDICESLFIDEMYSEVDDCPFVSQQNYTQSSALPIEIHRSNQNAARSHMFLNCAQPVYISGDNIGGNINIAADATYGLFDVVVENSTFNDAFTMTFTGTSLDRLVRRNVAHTAAGGGLLPDIDHPYRQISDASQAANAYYELNDGAARRMRLWPASTGYYDKHVSFPSSSVYVDYEASSIIAGAWDAATNVFTSAVAHGRLNGDRIHAYSLGKLAGGLDATKTYYVVNKTGTTLQVSLTSGGAAVDVTSAGLGTQIIALADRPAMMLLTDANTSGYFANAYSTSSALAASRAGFVGESFFNPNTGVWVLRQTPASVAADSTVSLGSLVEALNVRVIVAGTASLPVHTGLFGFGFDFDATKSGSALWVGSNANASFVYANLYSNGTNFKATRAGGSCGVDFDVTGGATGGDINFWTSPHTTAQDATVTKTNVLTLVEGQGIQVMAGSTIKKHMHVTSGSLAFGTVGANASVDVAVSIGAAVGDTVVVSPNGNPGAGLTWCAWVSGVSQITIRVANVTVAGIVSANQTWSVDLWGH